MFLDEYISGSFFLDYWMLINGIIELPLIYFFVKKNKFSEGKILKRVEIKWYVLALLMGCAYPFIQVPINFIYNIISNENHYILFDFDGIKNFTNPNLISRILLIPICEELFFREYIQNGLQKKYTPFLAIGITSILFSAIHLPYTNLIYGEFNFSCHHAFIALFGGLFLGGIYYKSKSIGPSILLHICWNLTVYLI